MFPLRLLIHFPFPFSNKQTLAPIPHPIHGSSAVSALTALSLSLFLSLSLSLSLSLFLSLSFSLSPSYLEFVLCEGALLGGVEADEGYDACHQPCLCLTRKFSKVSLSKETSAKRDLLVSKETY